MLRKKIYLIILLLLHFQLGFADETKEKWGKKQLSEKEHYVLILECNSEPDIGSFQACQLKISYLDEILKRERIEIKGSMPDHHHGLPTSPEVTWSEIKKAYLINGLKFSMRGKWFLHFYINGSDNKPNDIATFNIVI